MSGVFDYSSLSASVVFIFSDADAPFLLASALFLMSTAFLSVRYHQATAHTATNADAKRIIPKWLTKYSIS